MKDATTLAEIRRILACMEYLEYQLIRIRQDGSEKTVKVIESALFTLRNLWLKTESEMEAMK